MLYKQEDLETKTMVELYRIAREQEIPYYSKLRKAELIFEIVKNATLKEREGQLWANGILDITSEGYGFLRPLGYLPSYDAVSYTHLDVYKRQHWRPRLIPRLYHPHDSGPIKSIP